MSAVVHRGSVELPLHNRKGVRVGTALVSVEDAHLAAHRWCLRSDGYVVRRKHGRIVRLHREVLSHGPGDPHVDHRDGNPLDCRRHNLRAATPGQNHQNRRPVSASSRFRGVWWDAARGKWAAGATLNYRKVALGRFDSEVLAAAIVAQWRADNMPYSEEAASA